MSFVSALKKAHRDANAARAKAEFREGQFRETEIGDTTQTSFEGEVVESDDRRFPKIRLVKRYLTREAVTDAIPPNSDCLTITKLYKEVTPPNFTRPVNSAANFVVFGIVATRSETRTSSQGMKYVTLLLSDLVYDIVLALHGKAYEKWKVVPGTLVAIFNPQFWVTKQENIRTLNLSVNKSECILEIGQASDIGQCEATTTTGKRCKNWVDVRKTHYCEFHVEQTVTRTKRPELNAQSAKLWDPRSGGSKLAAFRGGSVKWKQRLQLDTQALRPKKVLPFSFPDAPVGRVFEGHKRTGFFDDPQKRREKDRKLLARATEDATLWAQFTKMQKRNVTEVKNLSKKEKMAEWMKRAQHEDSDSDLEII